MPDALTRTRCRSERPVNLEAMQIRLGVEGRIVLVTAPCASRRVGLSRGFLVFGRALHDPLGDLAGDTVQLTVEPTIGHGALAGLVEQATDCLELLDGDCRGPAGEFEDWPLRREAV